MWRPEKALDAICRHALICKHDRSLIHVADNEPQSLHAARRAQPHPSSGGTREGNAQNQEDADFIDRAVKELLA